MRSGCGNDLQRFLGALRPQLRRAVLRMQGPNSTFFIKPTVEEQKLRQSALL